MNDAELNTGGLSVIAIFPSSGSKELYWEDQFLTSFGACDDDGDNDNNRTGAGTAGAVLANGVIGPTHSWNGPTAGGGGSATALLCDDFGNARCINTWFYAVDLSSPVTTMTLPSCDKDGDGIDDFFDLDDDNDGVADLVEDGGVDALADHDSDGIPNYLDPQSPGFVDTNVDGIDDRLDFDRDGVINSFDLDSDNDGIVDLRENNQPDANSNGQVDGFADINANGLSDAFDPACTGGPAPQCADGWRRWRAVRWWRPTACCAPCSRGTVLAWPGPTCCWWARCWRRRWAMWRGPRSRRCWGRSA
jgi:hypothetical protein